MSIVREPDRLSLADALAVLETSIPTEQAKSRLRAAFIQKAFSQSPLYALPYDEAEIDWRTGLVKIPRRRERFWPTFARADFEAYFLKPPPTAGEILSALGLTTSSASDSSNSQEAELDRLVKAAVGDSQLVTVPTHVPAPEEKHAPLKLSATFMGIGRWARRQAQRIAGVSTPFGGVQLRQLSDTSFDRAQAERELMDEIWLQAGIEAYGAKDGARRLQEMMGQTRVQVIDSYFAENPEIKRWVERNIEAGTCNQAVTELREKREMLKQLRQDQRGAPPQGRVSNPDLEWLHRAASAETKVQRGGKT